MPPIIAQGAGAPERATTTSLAAPGCERTEAQTSWNRACSVLSSASVACDQRVRIWCAQKDSAVSSSANRIPCNHERPLRLRAARNQQPDRTGRTTWARLVVRQVRVEQAVERSLRRLLVELTKAHLRPNGKKQSDPFTTPPLV